MANTKEFLVRSIFGWNTQTPLLEIDYLEGGKKLHTVQLTIDDGRALALNILQGCEASVGDAFLIRFLKQQVGSGDGEVAGVIRDFRKFRDKEKI